MCFIINIYSDNQQSALKYLKDTKVNLMHTDTLRDSFNLELSTLINQVSTQYMDNP